MIPITPAVEVELGLARYGTARHHLAYDVALDLAIVVVREAFGGTLTSIEPLCRRYDLLVAQRIADQGI